MLGLKVGGVPEHFNLPWRMAIEEGKFRDEGIQLHWSDMGGGTGQMIRGLENETLDVAILLTEGGTRAILQGLDAKIIQVYVNTPLRWGIHVPYKSDYEQVSDLENKTIAISRFGSGSHLMSYVMAHQQGWNTDSLKFNVIGDVYGGLWALENDEAQVFLWEKYTTHPYTEQKKCRRVDEVITPWPCFVIAVRKEIFDKHPEELKKMCDIVNQKAQELKENENAIDLISWRYNLRRSHVENWLNETDWNYDGIKYPLAFEKTISYLLKLGLLEKEQAEDWRTKLF
ncbi:MAG: substrate-binding domain-containing protein [Crocinitomicaceae bacterium]|nr:substrate-binding domain-containing protein [Crocinitomicaceae bacterium]